MTIEPFRGQHGKMMGRARCDGGCGAVLEFTAIHVGRKGTPGPDRIDISAAQRRINENGWRANQKKQLCGTCAAAAREKPQKEEPEMTVVATVPPADVLQPTRDQKREIMLMLQEVYDTAAKRYAGVETDQTVANALGIARWGWVSAIREEFFGPAGNEATDLLAAEVRNSLAAHLEARKKLAEWMKDANQALAEIEAQIATMNAALKRLEPKVAAVSK
jgi:hypothetical protein